MSCVRSLSLCSRPNLRSRAATGRVSQPRRAAWHFVRAFDGAAVGVPAARAELQLRDDPYWRRLKEWHEAGVWRRLHQASLKWVKPTTSAGRAPQSIPRRCPQKRGVAAGANPTDRGKSDATCYVVVDRQGIPLAVTIGAANVDNSRMMLATVDAIEPIRGRRGRPCKRPTKLHADKAYDSKVLREELRKRGITPRDARRGVENSERLGRHRWVVERTLSWLLPSVVYVAVQPLRRRATAALCRSRLTAMRCT